jgi:hypothetical protein
LLGIGKAFFQTNINPDSRAYHGDPRYVADDSYFEDDELEEAEEALGTITIVVDAKAGKYYVIMPGLTIKEGTFAVVR